MVISFIGQDTICCSEESLKDRIKWYLGAYTMRDEVTVLCGKRNKFDEIVRDCVCEVKMSTRLPIKLVMVIPDFKKINKDILSELCDAICIFPSYCEVKEVSENYSIETMIRCSDKTIFYLRCPLSKSLGKYYRFALESGKMEINIYNNLVQDKIPKYDDPFE